MPSFEAINYGLRPSKSIQRQLVFNAARAVCDKIGPMHTVYVGMGSIWFTDFVLAHRVLGIHDMFSIEIDPTGFSRACFNSPYATVRILQGSCGDRLPELYADEDLKIRSWMVWLDYDYVFNESMKEDLRALVENIPRDSLILTTFKGGGNHYGKDPSERIEYLRRTFGSIVPDVLSKRAVRDENSRLASTLADLSLDFMKGAVAESGRAEKFLPAFRIVYQDSMPMVTVGGYLASTGRHDALEATTGSHEWFCRPADPIVAPHLTLKEAAHLQSLLPSSEALSVDKVRSLGFELDEEQIRIFGRYYLLYPSFAQILS